MSEEDIDGGPPVVGKLAGRLLLYCSGGRRNRWREGWRWGEEKSWEGGGDYRATVVATGQLPCPGNLLPWLSALLLLISRFLPQDRSIRGLKLWNWHGPSLDVTPVIHGLKFVCLNNRVIALEKKFMLLKYITFLKNF